jgi:plastocyanin
MRSTAPWFLRTRAFAGVATISLALLVAACSGGATTAPTAAAGTPAGSAAAGSPAAGGSAVSIVDFAFNPTTLTVAKGTSVTWTNTGTSGHTVSADDKSFDSDASNTNATLANGATFSHTFDTAGTFAYHCKVHSSMTGTITVTP